MEVVDNKALRVRVRSHERFTSVIPKSHYEGEIAPGVHEILVHWGMDEALVLKNMGVKGVPSPISKSYKWPGIYKPMAHQRETAEFLTMHKKCFCFDEMGCGKRLAYGTPILTPYGWVSIESLQVGDKVMGRDGGSCNVTAVYHHPDRPLYRITFNDGCTIDADDEHLWQVQHVRNDTKARYPHTVDGRWRVLTTAQIVAKGVKDSVGNNTWRIPLVAPVQFDTGYNYSQIDPYLLGALLGDGYYRSAQRWGLCTDMDILHAVGAENIRPHETCSYVGYGTITSTLSKMQAEDKRVPGGSLLAPVEYRKALLSGLLDTDGTVGRGGTVSFSSCSERLAADVVDLVRSLGGTATCNIKKEPKYTYKGERKIGLPAYMVTIRLTFNPFRLPRKASLWKPLTKYAPTRIIKSIERIENAPGACISVDSEDSLYVTKDYIVTHNTAAAAWAADYLMDLGRIKRVLVICPVSIMQAAWQQDLFKVLMHRTVGLAHGSRDKRVQVIDSDIEFVIINYDGVPIVEEELQAAKFDLIICDESNNLKNSQAKRSKAVGRLIGPNTHVWLMTGSPAAQSPEDAYGLAKIVSPERVPKFFGSWRDMVMQKLSMYKWVPRSRAKDLVHNALQPAIRHTKEECLDLPEMVYVDRVIPLSPQQTKYYKVLKEQMLALAAGEEITAVNAASQMSKLLQLATGAIYADASDDGGKVTVEFDVKPRLDALEDVINESIHKVIIFAPFRHTIRLLERDLAARGFTTATISGDVSQTKRGEIFAAFQYQVDPKVIIIQPQAAAHGVTLTEASTVVWFGPTTSLDIYLQANARAHRKGQKNKVTVVHMQGSEVEAKLYKALSVRGAAHVNLMDLYKEILET